MRTIYRYVVPVDDQAHLIVLTGPIVHVATRSEATVEFWAVADSDGEPTTHWLQVIGTGHPMSESAVNVIGTAVTPTGRLVWHLVEMGGAS